MITISKTVIITIATVTTRMTRMTITIMRNEANHDNETETITKTMTIKKQ